MSQELLNHRGRYVLLAAAFLVTVISLSYFCGKICIVLLQDGPSVGAPILWEINPFAGIGRQVGPDLEGSIISDSK